MREVRLFLVAILLPAVIVAAGGVRLLVYMWESMWTEERRELEARAHFIADAIEDRTRGIARAEHLPPPRRPPLRYPPPRRPEFRPDNDRK